MVTRSDQMTSRSLPSPVLKCSVALLTVCGSERQGVICCTVVLVTSTVTKWYLWHRLHMHRKGGIHSHRPLNALEPGGHHEYSVLRPRICHPVK